VGVRILFLPDSQALPLQSSDQLWLSCLIPRIDPTGEFSKQRQTYFWFWTQSKSSAEILKNELTFVREEAEKKCDKLRNASEVQTGMEILHYFILDLLGRSGCTSFFSFLRDLIIIQRYSCCSHLLDQDRGRVSDIHSDS
jgi:hypothetical protein